MASKPNPDFQNAQAVVERLCKTKNTNWGKEIKIAKRLLKKNPDIKFWLSLNVDWENWSLTFFLTKEGKYWLDEQLQKYLVSNLNLTKNQEIQLEPQKVGPDISIKKGRTMLDFVDNIL